MQHKAKKYLHDMLKAAALLKQFSQGRSFADYEQDQLLRSAVERQFVILGECLSQLRKAHPDVANRIDDCRQIIAFRNILVHGYARVDDRVVWDLLQDRLPGLRIQIETLLNES